MPVDYAGAVVSWTAPVNDGLGTITNYMVTSTPGGKTCTVPAVATLACDVSGLTLGTAYAFTVVAFNAGGEGTASAPSNSMVAATIPGAPTNVQASAGNAQATVSWSAPAFDGFSTIIDYTVLSNPGGNTCSWSSGPLSCTVTGLTNGTTYSFAVIATNGVGFGEFADSDSVTPQDTQSPIVSRPYPNILADMSLTSTAPLHLTWADAVDNSGIDHYDLQRKKAGHAWKAVTLSSPTATEADVLFAPAASYRFRLRATDTAGNTSGWATTPSTRLRLLQESAAAISYRGGWSRKALEGASGGYVRKAATAGAKATYVFHGTSVAVVSDPGPARGKVEIWLDGARVTTIDLYAASTRTMQIVWAPPAALATGTHTLQLRPTGTKRAASSSTRIDLDALIVW